MLLAFLKYPNVCQQMPSFIRRTHASLTQADRIKNLHFENKQQFGAVVNQKKKRGRPRKTPETETDSTAVTTDKQDDANINETNKTSEIFYLIETNRSPYTLFAQPTNDSSTTGSDKTTSKTETKIKLKSKKDGSSLETIAKEVKSSATTSKTKSKSSPKKTPVETKQEPQTRTVNPSKSALKSTVPKKTTPTKNERLKVEKFRAICPDIFLGEPTSIPFLDTEIRAMTKYPLLCQKSENNDTETLIKSYPSVSKVLQATMPENSRNALKRWKLQKIAELGEEGFRQMQAKTFATGSKFHKSIENFLTDRIEPDDTTGIEHLWDSISPTLQTLDAKPLLTEKYVTHPILRYKGIVDCVSIVQGKISVVEWKTSDKIKPTLFANYDGPIQLCAYLGALNADKQYDIKANHGFFVVAYKNGTKANTFFMADSDIRMYWQIWLKRLQEFWIRRRDGTIPEPI